MKPTTAPQSVIYRVHAGQLQVADTFPTFGATDAAVFSIGDQPFVAIAESLTENVRFRMPSRIYRVGMD